MPKTTNANVIDLRKTKGTSPSEREKEGETQKTPPPKQTLKQNVLYEWSALEFEKREKDVYWYSTLAIVSAALAIFFLFTKNYLGALVTVLLAALIYVYSQKDPRTIRFAITPLGVKANEDLHPFEELISFWIFYEPGEIKELSIRTRRLASPYLGLPLGNTNPIEIRKILLRFLPEKKQEEPVANILARKLGF